MSCAAGTSTPRTEIEGDDGGSAGNGNGGTAGVQTTNGGAPTHAGSGGSIAAGTGGSIAGSAGIGGFGGAVGGSAGAPIGGSAGATIVAGQGGAAAGQGGASAGQGGSPPAGAGGQPGVAGSGGIDACGTGTVQASVASLPVDVIWVVDNSASMKPSIDQVTAGINAFTAKVAAENLDYRVIMLALRGTKITTVSGSKRYPVCVPAPLAGDDACGDGARFFQVDVDILSTQPLEQLLGTLGQTKGYTEADGPTGSGTGRGGRPWKDQLRPTSTKSFVVVTDDNSRLSANDFLHFKGGTNPNNSNSSLPPGILDSSWNGLFSTWVVNGIVGAPTSDATKTCMFADGTTSANAPIVYANLIDLSGGKRQSICDGAPAWQTFFDDVLSVVAATSQIDCTVPLPPPPANQSLNPSEVNVSLQANGMTTTFLQAASAADCDASGGYFYDNPLAPTSVTLCPASCQIADAAVGAGKGGSIQVEFGCHSAIKP